MKKFKVYSAQTGSQFAEIAAQNEEQAIDLFAQGKGFAGRHAMWKAGRFEYVAAAEVA